MPRFVELWQQCCHQFPGLALVRSDFARLEDKYMLDSMYRVNGGYTPMYVYV